MNFVLFGIIILVMLDKIQQNIKKIYYLKNQFNDVRVIGLFIFLIIVLLISWSGVKAIQSNYTLQKQIATLNQESQIQQLENNNLKLQNEYYNTNQYLELSARENLGLGDPGETEVLVPKNTALAQLLPIPSTTMTQKSTKNQSVYEKNFEAWIDFILNRQNTSN